MKSKRPTILRRLLSRWSPEENPLIDQPSVTVPRIVDIAIKSQHEPFILVLTLDNEATVEVANEGEATTYHVGDEYIAPGAIIPGGLGENGEVNA